MSDKPFPFPTKEHHEPAAPVPQPEPITPDEATIDHGVVESFPASDPVSVSITKVSTPVPTSGDEKAGGDNGPPDKDPA